MKTVRSNPLRQRLEIHVEERELPGLRLKSARERFLRHLIRSLARLRVLRTGRFSGSTDPADEDFDAYAAILTLWKSEEREEAIWVTFLATCFGRLSGKDSWKTLRCIYGQFGKSNRWRWVEICKDLAGFRRWIQDHREQVICLRFGNHRKYETHDPRKRGKSTVDIIESYVLWVREQGQGLQTAIFERATKGAAAEDSFDELYRGIRVTRFGRTAKFDWLCLIGDLGLYPMAPGRCYLEESSGPLKGACLAFQPPGRSLPIEQLEREAVQLSHSLQVPIEAMEDTLCNWQKGTGRESGWLRTACSVGELRVKNR